MVGVVGKSLIGLPKGWIAKVPLAILGRRPSKITNKIKLMMGEGSPKFHIGEPGTSQKREKDRQRGGLPKALWQS